MLLRVSSGMNVIPVVSPRTLFVLLLSLFALLLWPFAVGVGFLYVVDKAVPGRTPVLLGIRFSLFILIIAAALYVGIPWVLLLVMS